MEKSPIVMSFMILSVVSAFAQKEKTVVAEYEYIVPMNQTLEEAKLTALDRAKIKAIEDEYGAVVTQDNTTLISNEGVDSSVDFLSVGGSHIKGEWVETLSEPTYEVKYLKDQLVVKAIVKGKIQESKQGHIDLDIQVLCNGTEPRYARTDFSDGDEMYVRFQSPVSGYLLVYLIDYNAKMAYCILPYRTTQASSWKIEKDTPYILFSENAVDPQMRNEVDEYVLTCDSGRERNDLYFIFSTRELAKSNLIGTTHDMPKQIPLREFHKWLGAIKHKGEVEISKEILTICKK